MEKINVAELLKDCPSNMELDCTMYEDVRFDYVDELNIIHCYIQRETHKTSLTFNQHGTPNSDIKSKCVIFPKDETTWEGFVPPCEFKDGDIISAEYYDDICIFKDEGNIKGTVDFYCGISGDSDELLIKDVKNQDEHFGEIDEYKLATEEEKEKLFKVIKYNGYKWNPKTKSLEKLPKFKVGNRIRHTVYKTSPFTITEITDTSYKGGYQYEVLIEQQDNFELDPSNFDINTLKPFDKVLVRDSDKKYWGINLFGFYNEITKQFHCMGNSNIGWNECIPYEGNEHLLGTTNDCDEFYKNW